MFVNTEVLLWTILDNLGHVLFLGRKVAKIVIFVDVIPVTEAILSTFKKHFIKKQLNLLLSGVRRQ